jgi:hypothetical protein
MEPVNELALSGPDVTATDPAQGSILFVGTATVIIRYAGITILTDPNFLHRGDHVHLGHGMTAIRRTDPALELEALPPVDFVVLSHMKSRRDAVERGLSEDDRDAVLAAYPRTGFKRGIVLAFSDGFAHKPATTFGTMNSDVLERTLPGYRRPNFRDFIAANPLDG